jgi:hypothetical protein
MLVELILPPSPDQPASWAGLIDATTMSGRQTINPPSRPMPYSSLGRAFGG